jgi:hypothetical protein
MEEETFIAMIRDVHTNMDPAVPEGATIFLGDSITMCLAVVGGGDVESRLDQVVADQLLDVGVVLDHQNAGLPHVFLLNRRGQGARS